MQRRKILLIEDDASLAFASRYLLEDLGYDVFTAATHEQAREASARGPFCAVIVDYLLDNVPAGALIRELQSHHPQTPLLCTTAADAAEIEAAGVRAQAFLAKPFQAGDLERILRDLTK